MDGTILSVIGVGVALAAIILNGQRAVRSEINGLRTEFRSDINGLRSEFNNELNGLRSEINGLRSEINGLRSEVRALGERVARIEGQLAGPPRFLGPRDPNDGEQAA